jgi:hypothetical protein
MKTLIIKGCTKPRLRKAALAVFLSFSLHNCFVKAQEIYDNHEGKQMVHYQLPRNGGRLDSSSKNPKRDRVNNSYYCGLFKRSRVKYDYVKMIPPGKLENVSDYATYDPHAPKIRMKVFTDAPVGSMIEVQLGKRNALSAYPEGTHSQFHAVTTTSGQWEQLEFRYSETPEGSTTSASEVDQVTVLFIPNSSQKYDFYFDDLSGPQLTTTQARTARKVVRHR